MKKGAFTFVLHSHIPYCRGAGRWPHGEEWLHEAAIGTYLPLLRTLFRLVDEGCPFNLTIGITPVLMEQLADPLVLDNLDVFLQEKIVAAGADASRFQRQANAARADVARWHQRRFLMLHDFFTNALQRDIIGAFRRLQDAGHVEVATSAATHGYLPLLERDSSVYAQIATGVETYQRHLGLWPRALWLPECGYRPPYWSEANGQSYRKSGLEEFLAAHGIVVFFAETHTVEGGTPVGKATGDALGPYGEIPRRRAIPPAGYIEPTYRTTYLPYWVQSPRVAVLGRNNRTGLQVWSGAHGYPGDYWYREFHKRDDISGLHYWRVTGTQIDLAYKEPYDPDRAARRTEEHSRHFARLVEELITDFYEHNRRPGVIAAIYDTELLGHWWFEGIDWLGQVLRHLAASEVVELTTASRYIEEHPPEDVIALAEGSWGQAGNHFTWLNDETEWMWPSIHTAERRMEALVARFPNADGALRAILDQAGRELLLLQASDWPFLITTGQAVDYAQNRFGQHLHRFQRLADAADVEDVGPASLDFCRELQEIDRVFPNLDYRLFAEREGQAK